MKSFGITSLSLILALFQVASVNAMRPHSFLIPNTEVMTAAESKNAEVTFSRRWVLMMMMMMMMSELGCYYLRTELVSENFLWWYLNVPDQKYFIIQRPSHTAFLFIGNRRGSNANSNSNNKEVDTVVRILRGNNWGMTSSSSSSSSSTTTFVSGAGEESSSRSNWVMTYQYSVQTYILENR